MSDINWGLIRDGHTFESLIHSLISFEDPRSHLYSRLGRDDGQDARSGDSRAVYQMKFHRTESTSLAMRDARAEAEKIGRYKSDPRIQELWQGVQEWILVTNAAFNPRDHQKWADEVEPLFNAIGLRATYWGKAKIEALLHKYPDLKEAYFSGEARTFLSINEACDYVRSQESHALDILDIPYQGREEELSEFRKFLDSPKKLLIIHGAGGVGKTRLLLEGARVLDIPEGWQVFWANTAIMKTSNSWFRGLIGKRPTLLLVDEPQDTAILEKLVEVLADSRATNWKVAVTFRSQKDPVLSYLQKPRMQRMVKFLPLMPLQKAAAISFCVNVLKNSSLNVEAKDRVKLATEIARYCDYYPIWIAVAVYLLGRTGSLEEMPQEVEGLASEYLEEILKFQEDVDGEKLLALLRWTALIGRVNREDVTLIEFVRSKVGMKNLEEVQRCFDVLIERRVIFEQGAYGRLLEIKPDVLADYILRSWLTYEGRARRYDQRISSDASDIIRELIAILDSEEASNLERLLLRGIARFELVQGVNILSELLEHWCGKICTSTMKARQKLAYLSNLNEISFSHISEVLEIVRVALDSDSEPESISTIFGEHTFDQDDVILALAPIVQSTALYAEDEQKAKEILLLLFDLVVAEHDILMREPQRLPNDGRRAETVLHEILTNSSKYSDNFESIAFEEAQTRLERFRFSETSEHSKLILNALVKPLLKIERHHSILERFTVKEQIRFVHPDGNTWNRGRHLLVKIRESILDRSLQLFQTLFFWELLSYSHQEINRALLHLSQDISTKDPNFEVLCEIRKQYEEVLEDNLQWTENFLNSHNTDTRELIAAREIWEWHYKFEKKPALREVAERCEDNFRHTELFPKYAPLLSWESYETLGSWAATVSDNLSASEDWQVIRQFVRDGINFLGSPDEVYRLFIVAEHLGSKAQDFQAVRKFVEEALSFSARDPEFRFAAELSASWIWHVHKSNDSSVISTLELLYQWLGAESGESQKIVHVIQSIYKNVWLWEPPIGELEVSFILKQKEHFLQSNSAIHCVDLLGKIIFASLDRVRSAIDDILNNLDREQLTNAVSTLLKSVNYATRFVVKNLGREIEPNLRDWVLAQVLRLPDIDRLGRTGIWHLEEILEMTHKPDLHWLVEAIERRIHMFSELNGSAIRLLPHHERLSMWIEPIAPEQSDDDAVRDLVFKLLSYLDASPALEYRLPQYLADIDPSGVIIPDLIVQKIQTPEVRKALMEILAWAKFAGYYPDNSHAWRKIAHAVCSAASRFPVRQKYSIFHALKNPEPKIWASNIGEVPPIFEKAVEEAQERLEHETDSVLVPFWKWVLESAEEELQTQVEWVKEEVEEW